MIEVSEDQILQTKSPQICTRVGGIGSAVNVSKYIRFAE